GPVQGIRNCSDKCRVCTNEFSSAETENVSPLHASTLHLRQRSRRRYISTSHVGCVSPIDARQCIAPAGHISSEPAAVRLEILLSFAKDAERLAPSNILRQQDDPVGPCANRSRRHYGRQPVVTTREKPQPTRVG